MSIIQERELVLNKLLIKENLKIITNKGFVKNNIFNIKKTKII
jgi:hypothetical protein